MPNSIEKSIIFIAVLFCLSVQHFRTLEDQIQNNVNAVSRAADVAKQFDVLHVVTVQ